MSIDYQKKIWEKNWDGKNQIDPKQILDSRFTIKAYHALEKFIDNKDKLILEAGCGTGRLCCLLAKNFPDSQVKGIDITSNSLKSANKLKEYLGLNNVDFEKEDIFQMPYPNNTFDVVFNEGVIEHFHNYKDSVKEMIRVTKPTGKIIVAVPNWYCFPHTIYKKIVSDKFEYGYEKSFKHFTA